jgi:hypothetical protein
MSRKQPSKNWRKEKRDYGGSIRERKGKLFARIQPQASAYDQTLRH